MRSATIGPAAAVRTPAAHLPGEDAPKQKGRLRTLACDSGPTIGLLPSGRITHSSRTQVTRFQFDGARALLPSSCRDRHGSQRDAYSIKQIVYHHSQLRFHAGSGPGAPVDCRRSGQIRTICNIRSNQYETLCNAISIGSFICGLRAFDPHHQGCSRVGSVVSCGSGASRAWPSSCCSSRCFSRR